MAKLIPLKCFEQWTKTICGTWMIAIAPHNLAILSPNIFLLYLSFEFWELTSKRYNFIQKKRSIQRTESHVGTFACFDFNNYTSICPFIIATLFSIAWRVLPSVTISVESFLITTLEAEPRTSFPAFSNEYAMSSLTTVPENQQEFVGDWNCIG